MSQEISYEELRAELVDFATHWEGDAKNVAWQAVNQLDRAENLHKTLKLGENRRAALERFWAATKPYLWLDGDEECGIIVDHSPDAKTFKKRKEFIAAYRDLDALTPATQEKP